MATILMAWELGAGLGHIAPLKLLAEELLRRGNRVALALRNLARAQLVFGNLPVECFQAPHDVRQSEGAAASPGAYVHLLANIGFNDPASLALRVAQCELEICNANHATVATLMRAGRPLLVLPITLEQTLLAIQLKRKGLAAAVAADDTRGVELWLRSAFERVARRFGDDRGGDSTREPFHDASISSLCLSQYTECRRRHPDLCARKTTAAPANSCLSGCGGHQQQIRCNVCGQWLARRCGAHGHQCLVRRRPRRTS